jgi:ABC-type transport system substrate-binding protein
MDALQGEALSTVDVAVRKRAYSQIEQLLVDDVPSIFLFYRKMLYGLSPQLQNLSPNGVSEGWNAADWSFHS